MKYKLFKNNISNKYIKYKKYRKYYTTETALIGVFYGFKKSTGIILSLIYGIPFIIFVTSVLIARQKCITHDKWTIFLVYIASLWSFLGPLLIWRYQHIDIKRYIYNCRSVFKNRNELLRYERKYLTNILSDVRCKIVLTIWVLLIVLSYITSYRYMCGFGILSYTDPVWVFTVVGIGLYAYLTGIGIILVWRTINLLYDLLKYDIVLNTYHYDGKGGMGFVGLFVTKTGLMFVSGSLYLPILMKICITTTHIASLFILFAIIIYVFMIFIAFGRPVYLLHKKINKEKNYSLLVISKQLNSQHIHNKCPVDCYLQHNIVRNNYLDLYNVNTWPFNVNNLSQIILFFVLPVLLAIVQILISYPVK